MKTRFLALLLALCCLGGCAAQPAAAPVDIVAFDPDGFVDILCAHARAYDSLFILNLAPSDTLEADVGAALDYALRSRFDCAYNVDSVVWNSIDKGEYIYCNFRLTYRSDVGPRPETLSYAALDWPALLHAAVTQKLPERTFCVPADQTTQDELTRALDGVWEQYGDAYAAYLVETCRWGLGVYDDYDYVLLSFTYRPDALDPSDIYMAQAPYATVLHMQEAFRSGEKPVAVYAKDIDASLLPLYLSIAQINDPAGMVEEAVSGASSVWERNGGSIMELAFQFGGTAEQREIYRAQVREALDNLEAELRAQGSLTDEQLYTAIVKAVAAQTKYDAEIGEASLDAALTQEMRYDRTTYGALVGGSTVCTGYAAAVKALCDRFSLPCWVLMGSFDEVGHAWNAVLLDGEIRYIDATFFDTNGGNSQLLFTQAQYESRLYKLEDGYALPDWYMEALQESETTDTIA